MWRRPGVAMSSTVTAARAPDPEVLSLQQAARYCKVSSTTIKRLVASGVLHRDQVAPWAPWEIKRADLDV